MGKVDPAATRRDYPSVPAHIAPYVQASGMEGAVRMILVLGGTDIYLPKRSSEKSKAAQVVGGQAVEKLAREIGPGYVKVPLARQWVAQALRAQGAGTAEIARKVRADVSTVRRWLNSVGHDQLDLFETPSPARPRG